MPLVKIVGVGAYIVPTGRSIPRPFARGAEVDVPEATARDLVKNKIGVYLQATEKQEGDGRPLSKQNVEELKATAAERGVDLGDATTRADILATIQAAEKQEGGEES